MGKSSRDFYVILPSNACPDFHPKNHASKYNVTWENQYGLYDGNWKVALTEANFMYPKFTYTTNYGIEYERCEIVTYKFIESILVFRMYDEETGAPSIDLMSGGVGGEARDGSIIPQYTPNNDLPIWNNETFSREAYWAKVVPSDHSVFDYKYPKYPPHDAFERPEVSTILNGSKAFSLVVRSRHRFKVEYNSDEYEWVNLSEATHHSVFNPANGKYEHYWGVISPDSRWQIGLNITYYSDEYFHTETVFYPENKLCNNFHELFASIIPAFGDIFKSITMEQDNKIHLKIQTGVTKIKFLDQMSICLGFDKRVYEFLHAKDFERYTILDSTEEMISATHLPVLNIGINHLYVYTSICEPLNVGGVMVPLLKSIWLDGERREYSHGDVINIVFSMPMYIPVAVKAINSIEVNIRNDYGKYIPFPDGAVTSLTLHFKEDYD